MKKWRTPVVTVGAVAAVALSASSANVSAAPDGTIAPASPGEGENEPTTTTSPQTTTTSPQTTTTTAAPQTTTTAAPQTTTTTSPQATTTTTVPGQVPASSLAPVDTSAAPTGPAAPAPLGVTVPIGGDYGAILATIRTLESGNRYSIGKNKGGASGAYQFIDRTWGNFGGYPSAYLAPPAVQDQKALIDVKRFLAMWNGDVSMVPVMWYYPKAAYNPALMDQVPMPGAGNVLTIRGYQAKWMKIYSKFTGQTFDMSAYEATGVGDQLGGPPVLTNTEGALEQVSFPVLGPNRVEADAACTGLDCDNGQDALIYGTEFQPVLAAFDGSVTSVDEGDPVTGEVSVTITDTSGRTYTYSGFRSTDDGSGQVNRSLSLTANARVGATVRAGMVLGYMGMTDPSALDRSPHIRLTIHDALGVRQDAYQLVSDALAREQCRVGIGPWSMPANSDIGVDPDNPSFEPFLVPISETDGFTFNADGTVNANGLAALIVPVEGCVNMPDQAFGPGAAGQPMPEDMLERISIDLPMLISGNADPGLR